MPNIYNSKKIILFLIPVFLIVCFSSSMMAEKDTIEEIEKEIETITEEERIILEELFVKAQEIEVLEREKKILTEEIEKLDGDIKDLEMLIEKEAENYEDKLKLLKEVLVTYQRMGPSSLLEILLNADSITNLFNRINILRDFTKNTGLLLESIEEIKESLSDKKGNLNKKLLTLEEKRNYLQETIEEEEKKKSELEEKLSYLKSDRQYYEKQLSNMMAMLEELESLMVDIKQQFKNILEKGTFPEGSIEYSISMDGIKVEISEEVFNKVIEENSNPYGIKFSFFAERVNMEIPEKDIVLEGSFNVKEGHYIEYEVSQGRFHDMLLTKDTVDEFFKEGNLYLDLEHILGSSTIKKIEIFDESIQITVDFKL